MYMALESTVSGELPAEERHPGGRHLDASRDDALREAALTLLAEIGYDRVTVDKIAAAAGAGKATIYRRWSGKAELVVDALMCHKGNLVIPDTGSLRGDLTALAEHASGREDELDTHVMIGLVSALPHDPELREVFHDRLVSPHIEILKEVLGRAVARGEIAPVANLETIASIIPGSRVPAAHCRRHRTGPAVFLIHHRSRDPSTRTNGFGNGARSPRLVQLS